MAKHKKKQGSVRQAGTDEAAMTLASYGLSGTAAPPVEIDRRPAAKAAPEGQEAEGQGEGQESEELVEESTEAGASAEELAEIAQAAEEPEQTSEAEPSGDEPEEEEPKRRDEIAKLKKQLAEERRAKEAAEAQMRRLQSENDKFNAQMQRFWNELQALKEQSASANRTTQADSSLDIHDDEFINGKRLKEILKQHIQKQSAPSGKDTGQTDQDRQRWVAGHPEYKTLAAYINDKRLAFDPDMTSIPTDLVGLYHAAWVRKLKEDMEMLKAQHKKEIEKVRADERARRGQVPPTGPGANSARPESVGQPRDMSDVERQFMGFFRSRGGNPRLVGVRR